jgi:hypothetical protein
MISATEKDPAFLRAAIYELARMKMSSEYALEDEKERARLSNALEVAIRGVERFQERHDRNPLLRLPRKLDHAQASFANVQSVLIEPEKRSFRFRIVGVFFVLGAMALALVWRGAGIHLGGEPAQSVVQAAVQPEIRAAPPTAQPDFPVPSNYGVYAISGDRLHELEALAQHVPDKRISISAPVVHASKTTIADGKIKFLLFRRDLVSGLPDRIDLRVVAKVSRAITFDGKGGRKYEPVSGVWSIRSLAHEFRTRPVPGNSEMVLVQSEREDFTLPPGRYALVLKNQGFDITISGGADDPAQCLDRTDAANGSFYSECESKGG